MAYVSAAVYDAVTAIEGGYEPYATDIPAPPGASTDAAVVEAAYRTLRNYFPAQGATLDALYAEALAPIADDQAKDDGKAVGLAAANGIIDLRADDGRMTPIGTTSSFPPKPPGPGVWRLTPPAFAAPQVPWTGSVTPFLLESGDQFLPHPPLSLESNRWVREFNEIKRYGAASGSARTEEQTAIARFWTANVPRQYNRLVRDIADTPPGLDVLQTARLAAMVNLVAADAGIAVMNAKYHYLFWRPVTAINPTAVTNDEFGPVPGFDDGNRATLEDATWQPLVTTPNHPEYPSAHGSVTSAVAEVLSKFLKTNKVDLDIHGFDPAGPAGNLNAVRHFERADDLRGEIIDARLWGGLHYRSSTEVGLALGRNIGRYDLRHAFKAR